MTATTATDQQQLQRLLGFASVGRRNCSVHQTDWTSVAVLLVDESTAFCLDRTGRCNAADQLHRPSRRREGPANSPDRSFNAQQNPQIWLRQNDVTIYELEPTRIGSSLSATTGGMATATTPATTTTTTGDCTLDQLGVPGPTGPAQEGRRHRRLRRVLHDPQGPFTDVSTGHAALILILLGR